MPTDARTESRRQFLRFLAESPLLASLGGAFAASTAFAQDDGALRGVYDFKGLIKSVDEALNVWDFETAMRAKLDPGHVAYLAQGSDDLGTIEANRTGFKKIGLRARQLTDIANPDMSVELFGQKVNSPVFLCPVGAQKMFHDEGEIAVARAANSKNSLQVLSTVANSSVENVAAARGASGWLQLYSTSDWPTTHGMLKRAEDAGCTAVAWTVDIPSRNLELVGRFNPADDPTCQVCHSKFTGTFAMRPMFDGVNMARVRMGLGGMKWDYVDQLKKGTKMKVLIKGIVTREDAALAIEHGADGVVVSNHGGRSTESLRGTIDCLPEVVEAVRGRIPVFLDSGIRRGTDVFKALALGATAVGIGRPYIWGLSSFGQAGVEKVIDLLNRELRIVMQQMGTAKIADISRASLEML
jgi:4-hydroxymandelate oxidase